MALVENGEIDLGALFHRVVEEFDQVEDLTQDPLALAVYDCPSAVLILIYFVWVLAYDVPWSYAMWRLNQDLHH